MSDRSGFAGSAAEHPTGDMSIYDEDFITVWRDEQSSLP
jgi:hypothetical protein